MNDRSVEALTLLAGSAYASVLNLLEALREDELGSFPSFPEGYGRKWYRPRRLWQMLTLQPAPRRMFSIPEQGVHLIQVTRFTMNTVLDQLGIEEHPLHPMFREVADMKPSKQKRATLSEMNLAGAMKGLEGISSMQELRNQFETTLHWMAAKIDKIQPEHWSKMISHPLVDLEEKCLMFLHRMLVIHTHHHFGEMVVLAKLAGRTNAVPFAIGRVD